MDSSCKPVGVCSGGGGGVCEQLLFKAYSFGAKCNNNSADVHLPGDVVDHERPCGSAVVGAGDGPEALLPCRVPDLQLDLLAAHLDDSCTELHADRMGAICHDCGEEVSSLGVD